MRMNPNRIELSCGGGIGRHYNEVKKISDLENIIANSPDNFVIRDALATCFEVLQEYKHIVCSCSGGG